MLRLLSSDKLEMSCFKKGQRLPDPDPISGLSRATSSPSPATSHDLDADGNSPKIIKF